MKAYITSYVLLTLYISARSPTEGRATGSTLHLLLLNPNFWLGFSYSINMKKSIFVGTTISQLHFDVFSWWTVKYWWLSRNSCMCREACVTRTKLALSLSEWNVPVNVCARVHWCWCAILVCTILGRENWMCQCVGGVDEKLPQSEVPCGQHSGRAGSKSNLWVPALETQPQPKRRGQGTAKKKISLTQRLSSKISQIISKPLQFIASLSLNMSNK